MFSRLLDLRLNTRVQLQLGPNYNSNCQIQSLDWSEKKLDPWRWSEFVWDLTISADFHGLFAPEESFNCKNHWPLAHPLWTLQHLTTFLPLKRFRNFIRCERPSQPSKHNVFKLIFTLTLLQSFQFSRTTGELTIWLTIEDCLTVTIDGSKRTNY